MTSQKIKEFMRGYVHFDAPMALSKSIVYLPPADIVLTGVYFNSSAFSKEEIWVSSFLQVLTVPVDFVTVEYGERLKKWGKEWRVDTSIESERIELGKRISTECLPFSIQYASSRSALRLLDTYARKHQSIHAVESYAHLLAWNGLGEEALTVLRWTADMLRPNSESWEFEVRARCLKLAAMIEQQSTLVVDQLKEWARYTVSEIGVTLASDSPLS